MKIAIQAKHERSESINTQFALMSTSLGVVEEVKEDDYAFNYEDQWFSSIMNRDECNYSYEALSTTPVA